MANKAYCFKCKGNIDLKDNENHKIITRKIKNGLITNILCGDCTKCGGRVCTILGNQKAQNKNKKGKK